MENQREYLRCDVTGKLYPSEEMEVSVIKIVKHKDADINQLNIFSENAVRAESASKSMGILDNMVEESVGKLEDFTPKKPITNTQENPDVISKEELTKTPRKNPIPAGIFATMFPPGHPAHESRGAKEFRQT